MAENNKNESTDYTKSRDNKPKRERHDRNNKKGRDLKAEITTALKEAEASPDMMLINLRVDGLAVELKPETLTAIADDIITAFERSKPNEDILRKIHRCSGANVDYIKTMREHVVELEKQTKTSEKGEAKKPAFDPFMLMALSGSGNIDPIEFMMLQDKNMFKDIDPMLLMLMMQSNKPKAATKKDLEKAKKEIIDEIHDGVTAITECAEGGDPADPDTSFVYPAIFHLNGDNGSYTVTFPDLPGCISEGKTFAHAQEMAEIALKEWLTYLISEDEEVPPPSAHVYQPKQGEYTGFVTVSLFPYNIGIEKHICPECEAKINNLLNQPLERIYSDIAEKLDKYTRHFGGPDKFLRVLVDLYKKNGGTKDINIDHIFDPQDPLNSFTKYQEFVEEIGGMERMFDLLEKEYGDKITTNHECTCAATRNDADFQRGVETGKSLQKETDAVNGQYFAASAENWVKGKIKLSENARKVLDKVGTARDYTTVLEAAHALDEKVNAFINMHMTEE